MDSDNSDLETSASPSYRMLDLRKTGDAIEYAFRYNNVRVYVVIKEENLQGSDLLDEYKVFANDLDELDILFQFEDWVLDALQGFLAKVAPVKKREPGASRDHRTLLDFFSCPTYALDLVNKDGELYPLLKDYDPEIHGDMAPRTRVVDSPLDLSVEDLEFPSDKGRPSGGIILRSDIPHVPQILASELEQVNDEGEISGVPKKVRKVGTQEEFYFKPSLKVLGNLRELEALNKINQMERRFQPPYRTSRLLGLVVWDTDKTMLMGMLLEYIHGDSLADVMEDAEQGEKAKWLAQIEATLARLHEVGMVWGDLNPDNIIITKEGDAVLTDFGGGCAPDYIKPEDQHTAKGDLLGLEHLRDILGL